MDVSEAAVAGDEVDHELAAFKVETEVEFAETGLAHGFAERGLVLLAIDCEEAAAAGAGDLAAEGSVGAGELVPGVDGRIGDSFGEPLLGLPVQIHELAEASEIAALHAVKALHAHVFDLEKAGDDIVIVAPGGVVLPGEDGGRVAHLPRVKKKEIFFELVLDFGMERDARRDDDAIAIDVEARDSAVGSHVLILLADGLLETGELDVAGFFSQYLCAHGSLRECMQGFEKADEVTTGGAHGGARGDVGDGDDFEAAGHAEKFHGFASQVVFDLVDVMDELGFAVAHADHVVDDGGIDVEVHVFVDGDGKDESAVFAIEGGQVSSAAAEGDAEWSAGDDHGDSLSQRRRIESQRLDSDFKRKADVV